MQTDTVTTPDGRSLDVYLAGPNDGDVLLFHDGTPGAGIVSARFHELAAARRLRFVSFSRPGYGASTRRPGRTVADVAQDAMAVLDHVGAERCYVMGFSGGGPHALACAARLPDRVDAAAIVGSVAPYGVEGLDFLAGMAQENVVEFGAALAGSRDLEVFLTGALPALSAVTGGDVADALGGLVPPVDRAALTTAYTEALAADFRRALSNGSGAGTTTTSPSSDPGASSSARSGCPSASGRDGRTGWFPTRTANGLAAISRKPGRAYSCWPITATCRWRSRRSTGCWTS